MNRFFLFVLIASFLFACADRSEITVRKSKKDKASSSATAESDVTGDEEEEEGDDDTTAETEETTPAKDDTTTAPPKPVVVDVFANTTAYVGNAPGKDSTEHHQGSSNAGKECMSCHSAGKGAPTFSLGGTIRATKNAPQGAAGVEVRVVDEKGKEIAFVTTDSVGNFWFPGTVPITGGSRVAIRSASGGQKMSGAIATGACNSAGCHTSSLPIFLAN